MFETTWAASACSSHSGSRVSRCSSQWLERKSRLRTGESGRIIWRSSGALVRVRGAILFVRTGGVRLLRDRCRNESGVISTQIDDSCENVVTSPRKRGPLRRGGGRNDTTGEQGNLNCQALRQRSLLQTLVAAVFPK